MHGPHGLLLFAAALVAGAVNSVAGGGTLLTFPALLSAGIPAVAANATSTVALVPGSFSAFWGYRRDIGRRLPDLLWLGLPSLIGGYVGAQSAVAAGDSLFSRLVPWLILGATALFTLQEPVRRWLAARRQSPLPAAGPASGRRIAGLMLFQFFVALYGGFFGAGIGILMLAALGMIGHTDIHRMNGLKNFAAVCINGVAALTFIYDRRVDWRFALLMAVGAILGGWCGPPLARRLGQRNVRRLVVAIGLLIGLSLFARQYVFRL